MSTMTPTKRSRSRSTGFWIRQSHVQARGNGYWLGQSSMLRPAGRRRSRLDLGTVLAAGAAGVLLVLALLVQGGF